MMHSICLCDFILVVSFVTANCNGECTTCCRLLNWHYLSFLQVFTFIIQTGRSTGNGNGRFLYINFICEVSYFMCLNV